MGMAYNLCDCRNKDTRADEKLSTCNMKTNKKYFFRNNNGIKISNTSTKNTKDTLELNNAANVIIKNYKKYKEKKENENVIDTKIKYDKYLKRDKTKKSNNNNMLKGEDEENNYSSYISINSNLNQLKTLKEKEYIYIGGKSINGSKEGFGIILWNNKTKYIGILKNNRVEGYGKFLCGNEEYKGQFQNDVASGFGIYSNGDEVEYTGYWLDNLEENYGYEKWKNGSEYKGEYLQGKKHGIGTYKWNNGCKYEGNWKNNEIEGFGIKYYNKNQVYIGEWKNNLKDGFGELLSIGRKYIGFFSKDQKDGFGISYWEKSNKAFVGFWKNGKQLGLGKYMTRNEKKYGIWINNTQINWLKSEEEAFEVLENKGLKSYKTFFLFTLDDIRNYCINNDEFNELLN